MLPHLVGFLCVYYCLYMDTYKYLFLLYFRTLLLEEEDKGREQSLGLTLGTVETEKRLASGFAQHFKGKRSHYTFCSWLPPPDTMMEFTKNLCTILGIHVQ